MDPRQQAAPVDPRLQGAQQVHILKTAKLMLHCDSLSIWLLMC